MNSLQKQEVAAKAHYEEVKKINELHGKLNALVKKDFGSLHKFIAKIDALNGDSTQSAPKPRAKKVGKASGKKVTRKRITDAQLTKMKALRNDGVPQDKVAAKVGCSPAAVGLWESKKFKR